MHNSEHRLIQKSTRNYSTWSLYSLLLYFPIHSLTNVLVTRWVIECPRSHMHSIHQKNTIDFEVRIIASVRFWDDKKQMHNSNSSMLKISYGTQQCSDKHASIRHKNELQRTVSTEKYKHFITKWQNSRYSLFGTNGALQKYQRTSPPSDGLVVRARYFCLPSHCSISLDNRIIFSGVFVSMSGDGSFTSPPAAVASEFIATPKLKQHRNGCFIKPNQNLWFGDFIKPNQNVLVQRIVNL